MSSIGFVGIGHMGYPMACNLIRAGHRLTVFDINQKALNSIQAEGARAARNVSELAEGQDIVITMVQSSEQVRQVCLGEQGLFAHAKPGTLFIDSSSIDVESSRDLNRRAYGAGMEMIDAPVSGGVVGARSASLTFMIGGTESAYRKALPIVETMGKNCIHAGAAGNGQVAKICNNMLLGISMIGVSEAFSLGEKLGLSARKFFEISSKASGQCWSMTSYCPVPDLVESAPSNHDYKAGFTAEMMLKDLNLSQDAANKAQANTPLGQHATRLYQHYVETGQGHRDFSGIIEMISDRGGATDE